MGRKSSETVMSTDLPYIPPPKRPVRDPRDATRLQSKPMTAPPTSTCDTISSFNYDILPDDSAAQTAMDMVRV